MSDPLVGELRALVAEVAELEPSVITVEADLADVGIDSLLAVEIAVHIENRYGLTFEDDELRPLRTFGDLVELTRRHERAKWDQG